MYSKPIYACLIDVQPEVIYYLQDVFHHEVIHIYIIFTYLFYLDECM